MKLMDKLPKLSKIEGIHSEIRVRNIISGAHFAVQHSKGLAQSIRHKIGGNSRIGARRDNNAHLFALFDRRICAAFIAGVKIALKAIYNSLERRREKVIVNRREKSHIIGGFKILKKYIQIMI